MGMGVVAGDGESGATGTSRWCLGQWRTSAAPAVQVLEFRVQLPHSHLQHTHEQANGQLLQRMSVTTLSCT